MPVPDLEELEKEVSGMLNNLTDIRMEGSDLVLEGDGKTEKICFGVISCSKKMEKGNIAYILL